MAAGEAAPGTPDGVAAPTPPPQPSRLALLVGARRFAWPLVCLFQLGLILGGLRLALRHEPPSEEQKEGSETVMAPPPAPLEPPPAPAPPGEVGRADEMLREGRYETALAIYQPLTAGAAASMRDALHYRVGLCQEGLGRWDQALASYRAITSRSPVAHVAGAAQVGQARAWVRMRRPAEAKQLLYDLLLRSGRGGLRDQPLLAEVRYLLALALSMEALRAEKPGPLNEALAAHTPADWPVERALDWATPARDRGRAPLDPGEDFVTVRKGRLGTDEALVQAFVRQSPLADLLDHLAEKAGLRPQWSAHAQEQAAGRTAKLQIDNLPLPDVVRALTDPVGLVGRAEGGVLSFVTEQEAGAEGLLAHRRVGARRALRDALLAYPGHPMTPAAYLELGNLDVTAGRVLEGVSWYERLAREQPRSPVLLEAYYNLGLSHARLGDLPAARADYYKVVDRAPGHELAPLAYMRIGRLYLEEYDGQRAIQPLRRAVSSGAGSSTLPAAVVTLAAAYLMTGNPRAASALLLEHRSQLHREPYRAAAGFLDSFARYRATVNRKELEREASVLLAALLAAQDSVVLGHPGKLLAGQAYRELGLGEQMARVYEQTLPEVRGLMAGEMSFQLAEAWLAADKRDAGVKLLAALTEADHGPWTPRACQRLAEIALQEKQPEVCLKWCRQLLRSPRGVEVPAVMKLMGRAYEQAGDYAQAARCYAGNP